MTKKGLNIDMNDNFLQNYFKKPMKCSHLDHKSPWGANKRKKTYKWIGMRKLKRMLVTNFRNYILGNINFFSLSRHVISSMWVCDCVIEETTKRIKCIWSKERCWNGRRKKRWRDNCLGLRGDSSLIEWEKREDIVCFLPSSHNPFTFNSYRSSYTHIHTNIINEAPTTVLDEIFLPYRYTRAALSIYRHSSSIVP